MKKIDLKLLKRQINYDSLHLFGFIKKDNNYIYEKDILNDEFKVIIKIENNIVITYVIDNSFNEEYTNVDLNISGEFISVVRNEYEKIINSFLENCTVYSNNYHNQVKDIIEYINNKYNDEIEYLWNDYENGIFRNKKNNKWYAAILSVKENRINGDSEEIINVIDLMYDKGKTYEIIDNKRIFKGYHMNKNSWITIKLDGSVDNSFIYKYIDNSYNISISKK